MSGQSQTTQQPFVELNRRFRKLDQTAKAEETALDSYTVGLLWPDKNLSWDDLLKESRVVVLGELVQQNPRIGNLAVIGIDFCEPNRC